MIEPSDEENTSAAEGINTIENSVNSYSNIDEKTVEDTLSQSAVSKESNEELLYSPRIESALTVENVKQYEEQTDPINVEELMSKLHPEDNDNNLDNGSDFNDDEHTFEKEKDIVFVPLNKQDEKNYAASPAERIVTRGSKITGEPYEAITIDVQTDYSWLRQSYLMQQRDKSTDTSLPASSHPVTPHEASIDEVFNERRTTVNEALIMKRINEKRHSSSFLSSSNASTSTRVSETDVIADEDNPVIEVNLSVDGYRGVVDGSEHTFSTNSTASVLPPYILQYKAESKAPVVDYNNIEDTLPPDLDWDDLSAQEQDHYTAILNELREERKSREQEEAASQNLIDIEPHAAYGSKKERKVAKERAAEKMRVREVERQKQTAATNQTNFYAFARQLKTVNYSLSSLKCMEEGWTVLPMPVPSPIDVVRDSFIPESETNIMSGKRYHQSFVRKFYDNRQMFLAVFTDGTGSVWYSSGNLAVSMVATSNHGKLVYIIHEDKGVDEFPNIQAVFEPDGNCTCYYPDGMIRVNLTPIGGEYYSPTGERTKKWQWKDVNTHVHAPPFQPITFGLSKQIGIRIISQENLHVTFTDGKRSVRLNVGTRLRLKNSLPHVVEVDADRLYLEERVVFLQTLIEKVHCSSKFSHSPRREQIKLPYYLDGKMKRAAKARASLLAKLPPLVSHVSSRDSQLVPYVSGSAKLTKDKQRLRRSKHRRQILEQAKQTNTMSVEDVKFTVTVN